jgi:hypothetical protein
MSEIDDIRLDIETLLVLLETLDDGPDGDNSMHRAVTRVLADRRARLALLERIAAER